MKKLVLFLMFSMSCLFSLNAQITQTIKGQVVDALSQAPLIGVNVVLTSTGDGRGTATDLDGTFRFDEVPVGRHQLVLSYLGYENKVLGNLLLQSGKEINILVEMDESFNALDEVVVNANRNNHDPINELSSVSARVLSLDEVSRYSGTLGDPARMAQNYAGVSGASDDRNDIIIRGNSPTGVLWRMEGMDIPSPNHFATLGNTGGPVSMLNINNLQNSDFITSAFPAEYGNATSGVFDLKLRNGNQDKYEYLGQIGFNGFEAGIEGPLPIGSRASVLANYRYSTLGVFKALGLDIGTGEAVPEYQDLTFKINIPTEKAGTFSIWGIGGLSNINFEASENGDNNLYNEDDENAEFESNTGMGGIQHMYFFNNETYSKLSLSISGNENSGHVEQLNFEDEFIEVFGQEMSQIRTSVNYKLNTKINSRNRLSTGLIVDRFDLVLRDSSRSLNGGPFETNLDTDGDTYLARAYGHWQHKLNAKLTLNSGIYGQWFALNNSYSIEPRLGLEYELDKRQTFSFGAGLHSQMQPLTIYFQKENQEGLTDRSNEELDFFKSIHVVGAYDWNFSSDWRLKAEIYGQYLYDVAVDTFASTFSLLNAGADFGFPTRTGLTNAGRGVNYGIELTIEKFFSQSYYFLTTASLFDSRYQASDDEWRSTLFNSNYVLNVLGGKEFPISKNVVLTADAKFTLTGGRRFTPIDLAQSVEEGEEVLIEDEAFTERYDDYARLDIKVGVRHNAKKFSQTFFIDFQNVTNRDNVFLQQFKSRSGTVETIYQRGFFPDVRYQILF